MNYCVQVSLKFVYLAVGTFFAAFLRKYIRLSVRSYNLANYLVWLILTKKETLFALLCTRVDMLDDHWE